MNSEYKIAIKLLLILLLEFVLGIISGAIIIYFDLPAYMIFVIAFLVTLPLSYILIKIIDQE